MTNPWDKIFNGDFKSALEIADKNYLQSFQNFDLRARAICFFLLGEYDNALTDFITLNKIEVRSDIISDGTYLEIGLCFYAIGENEKAVEYFTYPIINRTDMKYTSDISRPASILFYFAIKLNRQDILKIATKELRRLKLSIPLFLLGKLPEAELDKMFIEQTNEILRNRMQCKVEFYKATKGLELGYIESYKGHISNCVGLTGNYLEFEYFIAQLEYKRTNSNLHGYPMLKGGLTHISSALVLWSSWVRAEEFLSAFVVNFIYKL
jgi:tetratricopeptide (TPR) repeat protein